MLLCLKSFDHKDSHAVLELPTLLLNQLVGLVLRPVVAVLAEEHAVHCNPSDVVAAQDLSMITIAAGQVRTHGTKLGMARV